MPENMFNNKNKYSPTYLSSLKNPLLNYKYYPNNRY